MILNGNRRASPAKLAVHLMNLEDNDHVRIHEIRGFISDDLHGAYHEAYGISRGTRCKKFLYSLSLNPPDNENVPIEVFEEVIERIEQKLGFIGQPRTIVFHEKKGRRHAHVVWSRINSATMTAIDPFEDKLKLNEIGRELFIEQGWEMPDGYRRKEDSDPYNYSYAEHQQAKRAKRDPKELKRIFAECWQRSDSRASFASALKEHGFILAKGDRRAFVAVDAEGEVYSVSKWLGIKPRKLRARLGDFEDLPRADEALGQFDPADRKSHAQSERDSEYERKFSEYEERCEALVFRHREEREILEQRHEASRIEEIKVRSDKLPTGLTAAWHKLSGRYEAIIKENELDAERCKIRDRAEYQSLIELQLQERRILQAELEQLQREFEIVSEPLETDPAQELVIPPDAQAFSIKAKVRKDPAYILNVITDKHENFSRPQVFRALAEYFSDPLELGSAVDIAMRSNELIEIQSRPVPRYSTAEMLEVKASLQATASKLSQAIGHYVSNRNVNAAINRQNKLLNVAVGANLSTEQETAIRHCLSPDQLSVVVGLAGAGKSTMLSAVRDAFQRQGYVVRGAALSGKAADGLESSSGVESRTLASLERSWKKGFSQLTSKDVLVIDEADMIGTRQLHRFITEAQKTGAKIILVGDPEQLQPINAGTPFRDITEQIDSVRLVENHRQRLDWQKQASLDLAEQRTEDAINAYEVNGNVKGYRDNSEAITSLVTDYMADLSVDMNASRLALAYRRKDVFAINQAIRSVRQSAGELSVETLLQTKHGKRAFAPSDRILLTENNHPLGIRNGMLGTVKSVSEDELEILLDANDEKCQRKVVINPKHYASFDHGYATTIHKSQGATVDRSYVLGSVLMDRHLTYVAMTRHKQDATLYGDYTSLSKMRRSGINETPKNKQSHTQKPRHGPTMH